MDITQQAEEIIEAATSADRSYEFGVARSPERIAWMALLGAFALFCTMTLTTAFGIYHYLFRSTVPISATLYVAKGTIGITGADLRETVERQRDDLTNTVTSVSTDSLSQATIQFHDSTEVEGDSADLLAAVTLQGNTLVTFNHAIRPRFDWSQDPQRIQFSRLSGQLDVIVTGADSHAIVMDIYTDDLNTDKGVHIQSVTNGRYRLTVSEDEIRLLNLAGAVSAFFGDEPNVRNPVEPGRELVVRTGNRSIRTLDNTKNLLMTGDFSLQSSSIGQLYSPGEPLNWNCSALPEQSPPGSYSVREFDGRLGVNLQRFDNATSHGEISCIQEFEGEGLDARHFDSLRILATFSLNYQSISLCGKEGSECPLMVHIMYTIDDSPPDNHANWFRGFYYEGQAPGRHKRICASCLQEHVDTNPSVWYTFDSGNLLNLIAEDRRPAFIKAIRFYASGHQFDTVVSEMMLLAVDSSGAVASG
ncbi:MAG: hypothetical protein OXI77_15700 [Chloroflexota bacterium]|nr:hypothetical protein [Chloroflexota bacterium]MDE2909433.1 hypothetical protein [Chloroflexota bacterium]